MVSLLTIFLVAGIVGFVVGFAVIPVWSLMGARMVDGKGCEGVGQICFILAQQAYNGDDGAGILLQNSDDDYEMVAADYVDAADGRAVEFEYDGITYRDYRTERIESLGWGDFGVWWIPHMHQLDQLAVDVVTVKNGDALEDADPDQRIELDETSGGRANWAPAATLQNVPQISDDGREIDVEVAAEQAVDADPATELRTDGGDDEDGERELVIDMSRYVSEGANSGEGDIVEHPERNAIRQAGPSRWVPVMKILAGMMSLILGIVVGYVFGGGVVG